MAIKKPPTKGFNNSINYIHLCSFPDCKVEYKKGALVALLPIRKENGKARYMLKLHINSRGSYRVYIIEPKIKKINGLNPPHIYAHHSQWNDKNQEYDKCCLCLHLPNKNEYSKRDKLSETIISWAIKWTEFYEICLLTGEWYGGGKHPNIK